MTYTTDPAQTVRRLHEHRIWVTGNVLAAAGQVTEEQRRAAFAIGQGSIWRTLLHLYAAEYVWLETLLGEEKFVVPGDLPGRLPGNQEGENPIATFSELEIRWKELDRRWTEYLANLRPAALDDIVYRVSTSSGYGRRLGTARLDILLHVCTHAQYTVAQFVNMLRQAGAKAFPDVMHISLARSQAAAAQEST